MLTKLAAAAAALALSLPATAAAASAGGGEARARVTCAGGAAELRIEAGSERGGDAATLRVELRVETGRTVGSLRIVLLHERTLVVNGARRTDGSGRKLRLRLTLPDWPGRETVTARVATRDGRTCRLQATI
jgi:hypothetical protein